MVRVPTSLVGARTSGVVLIQPWCGELTMREGTRGLLRYGTISALFAAAGCGPDAGINGMSTVCPEDHHLLGVRMVDSLTLEESDSIFLGNPAATFSVGPDGAMYIADHTSDRVLVHAHDGGFQRTIGRPGQGPGEFARIGSFSLVSDSMFFQMDGGGRRLNVFNCRTGDFRGTLPYDGVFGWLALSGDHVLIALTDRSQRRTVARIPLVELDAAVVTTHGGRLVATEVGIPSEYRKYPMLNARDDVKAVAVGDTTIAAFGGLQYLTREVAGQALPDTFVVPACRRRGSPQTLLDEWFHTDPQDAGGSHGGL